MTPGDGLTHDLVLARGGSLVIGPVGQQQLAGSGAERARECRREAWQEGRHAPGRHVLVALRLERDDDAARPGGAHRNRGRAELDVDQEARRVRRECASDGGLELRDALGRRRREAGRLERDSQRVAVVHGREREDAAGVAERVEPPQPAEPRRGLACTHRPRSRSQARLRSADSSARSKDSPGARMRSCSTTIQLS